MTPLVECEGTPRDLGGAQGRACREALRLGCRRANGEGLRLPGARRAAVRRALRDVRRHFPHQAEQLEGIARGAGLGPARIGRAMLEVLEGASRGPALASARPDAPLVARAAPSGALLRRTRPEGRFRSIELTLAALTTALLGVNDRGLALACDAGPPQPGSCAAPAALLVRDCLERFADVEPALEWCMQRPAAPGAAILMADGLGRVAGVQIAQGERRVLRSGAGLLRVIDGSRVEALALDALGAAAPDSSSSPQALAAALGPGTPALAWADPVGRRIRLPGADAAWLGV
ncbi:MAG TPA: hypothetical protein VIY27_11945 [Myxococcota bacterium]